MCVYVSSQIQTSPLQTTVGTTSVVHGTTPLSQIGMIGSPVSTQQMNNTGKYFEGKHILSLCVFLNMSHEYDVAGC